MKYEWDEAKRKLNIKKHGIDFIDIKTVFNGYTVTIVDESMDYGEERFITLGLLHEHIVVIVHAEKKNMIRIISARKATKNEQKIYFSQISY